MRARLKRRIFAALVREFEKAGISQADLARRLNKDTATISRYLSAPSNLELDTVSDMFFAVSGGVPTIEIGHPIGQPSSSDQDNEEMPPVITTTQESILDDRAPKAGSIRRHPIPVEVNRGRANAEMDVRQIAA